MKERLEELIKLLGLTPTQFATAIGVQRGTLQHVLSGRNEASLKIVTSIHNSFPNVSLEWLIYGNGMALTSPAVIPDERPSSQNDENLIFPMEEMSSPEFQNLRDISQRRKTIDTQAARQYIPDNAPESKSKKNNIKEVVIFYEDGTYQKFKPELKN